MSGARTAAISPFPLVWSTAARSHMRRIYRHVLSESKSAEIADRLVVDLEAKMRSLAGSGISGAPRDDLAAGLRAFPYRQRCSYFRIEGKRLVVVRILQGRQDISSQEF